MADSSSRVQRVRRIAAALVALLLLVAIVWLLAADTQETSTPYATGGGGAQRSEPQPDLVINFGLGRGAKTSTILYDACDAAREAVKKAGQNPAADQKAASLVEDSAGRCVDPDAAPNRKATDRPAVLATTVQTDLHRCGLDKEDGSFPANQVTATTELVGATGLRLTVTADPKTPIEVDHGIYCGRIVAERATGPFHSTEFRLIVGNRAGVAVGKAVVLLGLGGLAGILIRFLNDPVAGLVSPHRRYKALRRWHDRSAEDASKLRMALLIEEIRDALWYLDAAAAGVLLTRAEAIRDAATSAARRQLIAELPDSRLDDPKLGREKELRRRILFGVYGNYWMISLAAVLVVVVLSGLWTQYFQPDSFSGSQRDWIELLIFGLAAQVTASTTVEALGKLMPSSKTVPAAGA